MIPDARRLEAIDRTRGLAEITRLGVALGGRAETFMGLAGAGITAWLAEALARSNRSAEAMTLFAVACAAIFPVFHTGRPWLAIYWLLPYPNTMTLWPNFRSPLIWDVFAVSTYASVSFMFWFVGLIPDLATLRDRARSRVRKKIYGMLAMGWRGSSRQWHVYERAYLILAALATPSTTLSKCFLWM